MAEKKQDEQLIGGIALITLGVIFIINIALGWHRMWPLFLGFAGVMVLANFIMNPKERKDSVVGLITLFILCFFFLLFTNDLLKWGDMSYLWPVFMIAPGLGLLTSYLLLNNKEALTPATILILLSLVFITIGWTGWWEYWPLLLVIIGVIIIITGRKDK